jgi:ABC-type transport system involved in cytochrome c biogenesis permease subunit
LRSNFWLVTHVMSITLSYAAFALALVIGDITLGYYLWGSKNAEDIQSLSRFTYRTLQVGVVLLAAGTVLGGVWAADSWGRFWGWDPKETAALLTLIAYVAVLHCRYAGWLSHFWLAALAVVCFSLVILASYGVNVAGSGKHSYGFSDGGSGPLYVSGVVAVQFAYVLMVYVMRPVNVSNWSPLPPGDG